MFLHLIPPDYKFIKPIHKLFEVSAPNQHIYAIYAIGKLSFSIPEFAVLCSSVSQFYEIIQQRNDWEGLIVHGQSLSIFPLLPMIPKGLKIAWYSWGAEAYDVTPKLLKNLYMPHTRRISIEWEPSFKNRILIRFGLLHTLRLVKRTFTWPKVRAVMDRYDYCVPQVKEEYDLFKNYGLLTHTKYHPGCIGFLEILVDIHAPIELQGKDIQIGNSASPSNNHADAFYILRELKLEGRKMIVPLSYGSDLYQKTILNLGYSIFGAQFNPMVDFLPLAQYNKLIQSCGIVVMNHCRQQAVGNLLLSLWRGGRVFMNDTTVYKGFKRMGFNISLINSDLRPDNPDVFKPHSYEEIARHRELLKREFGRDVVVERTKMLLDKLRL